MVYRTGKMAQVLSLLKEAYPTVKNILLREKIENILHDKI